MFTKYFKMKILITSLFFSTILLSCSNTIQGKIEYRNDNKTCYGLSPEIDITIPVNEYKEKAPEFKSVYLINASINKSFEFTIKEIQKKGETLFDQNTFKVKLSPGEEKWIGCSKYFLANDRRKESITLEYNCTGQRLIKNEKLSE